MSLIKSLRNKKNKMLKLQHEIMSADLSSLIGKKVTLTGKCLKWYEDNADIIGMSYGEMKIITSKPKGVIREARYCKEDGFTFTVDFDNLEMRVGINDINEVK